MVCCSAASLAVGYIYLSCSHLYSFASYDRPYASKLCLMLKALLQRTQIFLTATCSNTDSVARKIKEESKITFRFEGNKKQFQFNSDLAEKVKSVSVALGKRKLDLVKTHLEELDSDIKKRNKLIRLADKSAAGWDLVNEYLSE